MSRVLKVVAVLLILGVLLVLIPEFTAFLEIAVALLVGWARFAGEVLPKVTWNPAGLGLAVLCLGAAAVVGHRFCAWLWKGSGHETPWRPRWTAAGLSAIVVLFAAGMAFTGVAHQVGWLLRSPLPLMESSGANWRNAGASLKTIAAAQADFRGNDRDGNRIQDFWRGDIQGLYSLKPEGAADMIKLIEVSVAGADAKPSKAPDFTVPSPKAGYWFRAMRFKDEGAELDPQRWAALAYPDNPGSGVWMFAISHDGTMFQKLRGEGPLPDVYPDDPLKEGWRKLD